MVLGVALLLCGQTTKEMLRLLPGVAYMWECLQVNLRFCFSGVYGPHSSLERLDLWDELAVLHLGWKLDHRW